MTPETYIETFLPKMEGWCWREKAIAMSDLVLKFKPAVSVEIGVFGARSLIAQALAAQSLGSGHHVYGIDPYALSNVEAGSQISESDHAWWRTIDFTAILSKAHRAITDCGVSDYCSLLIMDSNRASALFSSIQVLHIDGNHSEEISCQDVERWLPLVEPGGHIWMDDIHWPSTKRAQELMAEKCDRVSEIAYTDGTMAVALFRKR